MGISTSKRNSDSNKKLHQSESYFKDKCHIMPIGFSNQKKTCSDELRSSFLQYLWLRVGSVGMKHDPSLIVMIVKEVLLIHVSVEAVNQYQTALREMFLMFSLFLSQLGDAFEDDQHGAIKSVHQDHGLNPLTSKCNSISFIIISHKSSLQSFCVPFTYHSNVLLVLNRKVCIKQVYTLFEI